MRVLALPSPLRGENDKQQLCPRVPLRSLRDLRCTRGYSPAPRWGDCPASIMNRRKSRAGRSMENHVEYLLTEAKIPFEVKPEIDGEPDIIIPGKDAYYDKKYPDDKLFMLGVKTTCKDRWRQILNEALRIKNKHLMTIQEGISKKQLLEMQKARVSLIVPKRLHTRYPKDPAIKLLDVEGFMKFVRRKLAS